MRTTFRFICRWAWPAVLAVLVVSHLLDYSKTEGLDHAIFAYVCIGLIELHLISLRVRELREWITATGALTALLCNPAFKPEVKLDGDTTH